ncbi:mannose-1-phosphate guanylyltransferase [Alicyclobacillus pomorum]|uniref:mannose-1-phosphate guanylyltransferase n=1 Tax=Alicyclobacillus pomorum TaxID=204470 RepID=UPI0004207499|nr:sugar phosphate nucleotidyltransferase [Alicyclobacillus pomorum]
MSDRIHVLLMAGGKGTRLWPKSRVSTPKQFISFQHQRSLIQQSVERLRGHPGFEDLYVVAPDEYLGMIKKQVPDIYPDHTIVEPTAQSTTACLGYSLLYLETMGAQDEDIVIVLPADSFVSDDHAFRECLRDAVRTARLTDGIVLVGVQPSYPATAYGYVMVADEDESRYRRVQAFVEKPDQAKALEYFSNGRYYWNAGIFAWKISTVWQLFRRHAPEFFETLIHLRQCMDSGDQQRVRDIYTKLPKVTFEYSLVEKASDLYMIPARFRWADLGNWTEVFKHFPPDVSLPNRVFELETSNCFVESERDLVSLFGVHDLIVIDTKDVLFVCHRDKVHDLKHFLSTMEREGFHSFL